MISRRTFLRVTAAASAAAATGYVAKPYIRKELLPKLDLTSPKGTLTGTEMREIVALGETMGAPDFVPPARFFRDYVNTVTQNQPGFFREYRRAVALLTLASARMNDGEISRQNRFADLNFDQRNKVLQALLWQYPYDDHVTPKLEKLLSSRSALALRMFVMAPLIKHYYRSAYGWKAIGYQSFPGQPPLDPRAYTMSLASEGRSR